MLCFCILFYRKIFFYYQRVSDVGICKTYFKTFFGVKKSLIELKIYIPTKDNTSYQVISSLGNFVQSGSYSWCDLPSKYLLKWYSGDCLISSSSGALFRPWNIGFSVYTQYGLEIFPERNYSITLIREHNGKKEMAK